MTPIREALRVLGIERLALGVHDACFPCDADEDLGRGTPYGHRAHDLLRFAAELGFDTLQLGPQGETSAIDPSPYDGSAFARSTLAIPVARLVEVGLLSEETRRRLTGSSGDRSDHARATAAMNEVLDEAHARASASAEHSGRRVAFIADHADWLLADAMWEALLVEHGGRDFLEWSDAHDRGGYAWPSDAAFARRADVEARGRPVIERWITAQMLAHAAHAELRARARTVGLTLFADLQIGWSRRDLWAHQRTFLRDYRMGAPPSRTNPDGQPWGYPVLDPAQDAAVARLLDARFEKIAREYDGVRIDHPHGLVCPWVYRVDEPDPFHAVRTGARLHEATGLVDHPALERFAIARPEQLDRSRVRWDDHWVRELDDEQVDRYAAHIDLLIRRVRSPRAIACEVLSTMPYPLGRVLQRHALGRFRVTQKAALDDPRDVYRSENAQPADWIMVGNHDTAPIWTVAQRWVDEGRGAAHARYLAERLVPEASERGAFAERLSNDAAALARAKLAELFASPARNVYVWWGDLFGETDWYNRPGLVDDRNWSLRIPRAFRRVHGERSAAGLALDVGRALATALRARGLREDLARALHPDGV